MLVPLISSVYGHESQPFLNDETRLLKLLEAAAQQWKERGDANVEEAINSVFEARGEDAYLESSGGNIGMASLSLAAARRMLVRTGLDWDPLSLDPLAFVDRDGMLHLPFDAALRLAQAFAAAEPNSVVISTNAKQRRWEDECEKSTSDSTAYLVDQWRAGWTLARQWAKAGQKGQAESLSLDDVRKRAELATGQLWLKLDEVDRERRAEINRLRSLVVGAGDILRRQGQAEEAENLMRALTSGDEPTGG